MTFLGTYGGNFTTPGTSAEIQLQLVLNYTQDIVGNYSDVSWVFQMVEFVNANPFNNNPTSDGFATVETGVFGATNLSYNFDASNETIVIASGTRRVYHNADGTKTGVAVSASYDGGNPIGTASFSTTFDLPTIPRASTPTYSDSTPDAGDNITITTNRADGSFTHDLEYRWQSAGGAYTSIATGVGASTGWTVPSTLINDIPNATSRVLEIRTTTKSGATVIGTTTTLVTVGVPASVVPDFGTVTHAEATSSPDVDTLIDAYVQGWTKLDLAITSAVAGTGATIASKVVQVRSGATVLQTVDVTAGAADSEVVTASGTVTLRGIVTDSRGRTATEDVDVTVLAYSLPTVTTIGVQRSLSDGTPDEEGTYVRVDLNAAVQSLLVSAVQKNALTYRISTSPRDANTWTVKATTTPGGITFNSHAEVGTYSITEAFDIKIEVYDKLSSVAPLAIVGTISVAGVFLHLGNAGEGIGVGKYWEQGSVDALERMYQRDGFRVIDEDDTATETVAGIIEIATPVEVEALLDPDRAVTPYGLAATVGRITSLEEREGLVLIDAFDFSAASGITLDDCFDPTEFYRYRVVARWLDSTGLEVYVRLRLAGADITNTGYRYQMTNSNSGTGLTAAAEGSRAEWPMIGNPGGAAYRSLDIELDSPDVATPTLGSALNGIHYNANGNMWNRSFHLFHNLSTAYDGLRIYTNVGTITGHVQLFGYRKG